MTDEQTLEEIKAMVIRYEGALQTELALTTELADAKTELGVVTAQELGRAYESEEGKEPIVSGKNAETRKAQENAFVASSEAIQAAQEHIKAIEWRTKKAQIEVRRIEAQMGLYKAFLYSKSGH